MWPPCRLATRLSPACDTRGQQTHGLCPGLSGQWGGPGRSGVVRVPVGPEQGEQGQFKHSTLLGFWVVPGHSCPVCPSQAFVLMLRTGDFSWHTSQCGHTPASLSPSASSLTLTISTAWRGSHHPPAQDCSVPDLPGRQTVVAGAPDNDSWGRFCPGLSGPRETQ